jgi:hypothetical protein
MNVKKLAFGMNDYKDRLGWNTLDEREAIFLKSRSRMLPQKFPAT